MPTAFVPGSSPPPYYRVEIRATKPSGKELKVEAWLPDTFGFGIEATYAPFMTNGQFLKGKIGEAVNAASQLASGLVIQNQAATSQLFQGSGYASFALPLEFVADSNTTLDVMRPIRDLLEMVAPTKAGGVLRAPVTYKGGLDTFAPEHFVTLIIGRWFLARHLICKSVNPTWENQIEKGTEEPMRAKCETTFETMTVPTAEDILEWFVSTPAGR